MARINVGDLRAVYETTLEDYQLQAFVDDANLLVTEELAGAGLSDERLAAIEKYLAAHMASLRDPRYQSENIAGEWSYTVQGKTGMNLDATFYGQQAKLLDTSGTLDKLSANLKKARLTILQDVE